jgi:hypothetical protein
MLVCIWSFPWHADWLVASVTLAVAVETRKVEVCGGMKGSAMTRVLDLPNKKCCPLRNVYCQCTVL